MKFEFSNIAAPAILAVALVCSPALSLAQSGTASSSNEGNAQTDAGSSKMMKGADTKFAMEAAQGGQAEVQLGQLAQQKAASPDVKAFGQMMVDDHTKANDQLKSVASQQNMTLPASLDAKDQMLMTKLQNDSGPKFDKDYMNAMVKDHEKDIKEFQKESKDGTDPQLKSFATETLPVLQKHLQKAKEVKSSMGSK